MTPVASAGALERGDGPATAGARDAGRLDHDLGRRGAARERLLDALVRLDDRHRRRDVGRRPASRVLSPSAGTASATRSAASASDRAMPGTAQDAGRGSPTSARRSLRAPTRPPAAQPRDATALDAIAEQRQQRGQHRQRADDRPATTSMVPTGHARRTCPDPVRNMPAMATMTVSPETSTARPEVAAAMASRPVRVRPRAPRALGGCRRG